MINQPFFHLALSFIIVHEMDAIRCKEWRILPGLSLLKDNLGYKVFIFIHIPLYSIIFWFLLNSQSRVGLIKGLDIFFIVHIGLHLLFLKHTENEFKGWISWALILGAGLFGLVDLLVTY
ncbi:MAG: hypothetical protein HQ509_05925 [Candidatus Marinimicrobia bacterium]|nr:hypothetical protein [Candidatus Neomarinimicrobiota bacterium]